LIVFFSRKVRVERFLFVETHSAKNATLFFFFHTQKKHFQQLTREAAMAVVRDTRVVAAFAEVCKFEQDADTVRGVYFFYF